MVLISPPKLLPTVVSPTAEVTPGSGVLGITTPGSVCTVAASVPPAATYRFSRLTDGTSGTLIPPEAFPEPETMAADDVVVVSCRCASAVGSSPLSLKVVLDSVLVLVPCALASAPPPTVPETPPATVPEVPSPAAPEIPTPAAPEIPTPGVPPSLDSPVEVVTSAAAVCVLVDELVAAAASVVDEDVAVELPCALTSAFPPTVPDTPPLMVAAVPIPAVPDVPMAAVPAAPTAFVPLVVVAGAAVEVIREDEDVVGVELVVAETFIADIAVVAPPLPVIGVVDWLAVEMTAAEDAAGAELVDVVDVLNVVDETGATEVVLEVETVAEGDEVVVVEETAIEVDTTAGELEEKDLLVDAIV